MNTNLIQVLWVEDDPDNTQFYPIEASRYGLELVSFNCWEEAEKALVSDFKRWSAIILDAKCKYKKGDHDNAQRFLVHVLSSITRICAEQKRVIPWFVLSGGSEEELNDLLSKIEFLLKSGDTTVKTIKPTLTGTGANATTEPIKSGDTQIGTKLTVTVRGITPGDYTVTETHYNEAGTKVWKTSGDIKNSVTSAEVTVSKSATASAVLINNYGPGTGALIITKKLVVNNTLTYNDTEFTFEVSGLTAGGQYTVTYAKAENGAVNTHPGGTVPADSNGKITIKLYPGEKVTIGGITVGTKPLIREINTAGYAPSWKVNSGTVTHSDTAQATVDGSDVTIYFTNTTGAALPSTGGIGTHLYTFLGITTMLGAGMLLLNQRRRKEGPDAV